MPYGSPVTERASTAVGHPAHVLPDGGRLRVLDAGLACCALEFSAAALVARMWEDAWAGGTTSPSGIPGEASPAALTTRESDPGYDVLVVAGTITTALIPVIRDLVAGLGPHGVVVSFGACSTSGGPYWDSYCVVPGVESLGIPVAVHVPGCPPPPSAVLAAIHEARRTVAATQAQVSP